MNLDQQSTPGALAVFGLTRLARFARLAGEEPPADAPWAHALAVRATLSAYRDCAALGFTAEAREVVALVRKGSSPPAETVSGATPGA